MSKDYLWERDGHEFIMGWMESDKPHPGFGGSSNIYGAYCDQCQKCGMYGHEYQGSGRPGEYEGQKCGPQIRSLK
jgi:hypothetical protein